MYTNSQVAKRDIFTEAELTFANAQGRLAHITVYFHTRSCKRLGHNSQSIDRFRGSNAFVMSSVQFIWLKGYHRYWSRSCFAHWLEFSEDRIYPCGWIGMMSRPKRIKKDGNHMFCVYCISTCICLRSHSGSWHWYIVLCPDCIRTQRSENIFNISKEKEEQRRIASLSSGQRSKVCQLSNVTHAIQSSCIYE